MSGRKHLGLLSLTPWHENIYHYSMLYNCCSVPTIVIRLITLLWVVKRHRRARNDRRRSVRVPGIVLWQRNQWRAALKAEESSLGSKYANRTSQHGTREANHHRIARIHCHQLQKQSKSTTSRLFDVITQFVLSARSLELDWRLELKYVSDFFIL